MAAFAGIVVVVLSIIVAAWISSMQRTCRVDPIFVDLGPLPKAEGFWAHESNVENLEKIVVGPSPEDVAFDSQGRLYTALSDGWIKRIGVDGKVENHTFVGGRPLGIALGPEEEIYFTDPSLGLFKISSDGIVHKLFPNEADTIWSIFLDGVAVGKDGTVYFTDASMHFGLEDGMLDFMDGRATGRVLKYDPVTKSSTLLLEGLGFANGVALSESEDFILVCETSRSRVVRYWLKGGKQGTLEPFLDALPGYPDNVRLSDGNFYIGLVGDRTVLSDWMMRTPSVRCFVAQSFVITAISSELNNIGRLIVVSPDGNLLTKYEDPTGRIMHGVTGGSKSGGYVYINSLTANFIGRLKV